MQRDSGPLGLLLATIVAAASLAALSSCSADKNAPGGSPTTRPKPVSRTAERGPIKLTVALDQDHATIAQEVRLTLTVDALDNVDVNLPDLATQLEPFHVRGGKESPAIPTATGRQWRQEYVIEAYAPGDYQTPQAAVQFSDRRDPNAVVTGELTAPPLTLTVTSVLDNQANPAEFADIRGTVDLPDARRRRWLAGLGIAAVVAGGLLATWLLWRGRRRKLRPIPPVPPHEWALAALRQLQREDLPARGETAAFYFRLTAIVRQYIERRFSIMAYEQTTDEFLVAAQGHPSLGGTYGALLASFLRAGDLVKFARYQPGQTEIDQAFAAAWNFVSETAPPPEPAGAATPAEAAR